MIGLGGWPNELEDQVVIKKTFLIFSCLFVFLCLNGPVYADRCLFSIKPVQLSEESQKAIILHNLKEEVLILATELRADGETEVLEFIPLPSEPTVTLADGDPFGEAVKLIAKKKLEFEERGVSRGSAETVPVEIRFAEKIGVHDVTVIKINDLSGFSRWTEEFFVKKGVKVSIDRLSNFYKNAEDYLRRGFHYFVFDYVKVSKEIKLIEPLVYRFRSERLYYPLRTSNVIGGKGTIDLILILPGTIQMTGEDYQTIWRPTVQDIKKTTMDFSSSAKVYPHEIQKIYPGADDFFKSNRVTYMQVLRYSGDYQFREDLFYDLSNLVPFAYKIVNRFQRFEDLLTADELRDYLDYLKRKGVIK
ncbi:MAG: DUF2330 domain-containing protein [Deltaproteobacteria bacterium]|nr:DUF2330 domain-containing protein [Deltaproteobacteria bacterium]